MANLSQDEDGHIFDKFVKSTLLIFTIHCCKICNFCTSKFTAMSEHVRASHPDACASALEELAGLSAEMADLTDAKEPSSASVNHVLSEISNLQCLKTFPYDQVGVKFLSDSKPMTDSITSPTGDLRSRDGGEIDDPCKKIATKLTHVYDFLMKENQLSQREITPKGWIPAENSPGGDGIQKMMLVPQLKKKNQGSGVRKSSPNASEGSQSVTVKEEIKSLENPIKLNFEKAFQNSLEVKKKKKKKKVKKSQSDLQLTQDSETPKMDDDAGMLAEEYATNIEHAQSGEAAETGSESSGGLPSEDIPTSSATDNLHGETQDAAESMQPESSVSSNQPGFAKIYGNVDFQAIAQRASQSNPEATTITVVQHTGGQRPPMTIHFKKSAKSKAIIPTGESLGISSPFTRRDYMGSKVFACKECHSRYKTANELEQHVAKKHQKRKKCLCEICGAALATRSGMNVHIQRMHGITDLLSCNVCDYMTRSRARLTVHMKIHNKETSEFYCEPCDKRFVTQSKLDQHKESPMHKNSVNPIICEHCGYVTKKRDNFLVHIRKHTGEKPYRCSHCDYASSDGSTLKRHVMARHSNIRPFRCQLCHFSCVDRKSLTIHMRKHTGERPFECDLCPYAAKRRGALTIHRRTHFPDGSSDPNHTVTVIQENSEAAPYLDVRSIPVVPVSLICAPQQAIQTPGASNVMSVSASHQEMIVTYSPTVGSNQLTQENMANPGTDQTAPALWQGIS